MRKKIIAANYKMNLTVNMAEEFVESIKSSINRDDIDVVICPNNTCLDRISNVLDGTNISLGAQNVYFETQGAYTGETSVDMIYSVGCDYAIVGHSERRQMFNETNEIINKKVKKIIEKDMNAILCVGETLEERESNKLYTVISNQIVECLKDIDSANIDKNLVIAYEPIWAIGTGVTATVAQAEDMCKFIRDEISKLYNESVSSKLRIQYGGSVNPSNAKEILTMPNIDGALVGGASIKNDFVAIVNYD